MKFAVIVFPGTTCEMDMYHAIKELGEDVELVEHTDASLEPYDAIILPGGTSYGDYLRPGAIASRSPMMNEVKKAAEEGKPVLGVGNGFQILLEANLLPGAMLHNEQLKFICEPVELIVKNKKSMFTKGYEEYETVTIPIAHKFGNYYCDEETLTELKENDQIIFTYKNKVNGSVDHIAGITNKAGNVLGIMPHPERAVDPFHCSQDGAPLFRSLLNYWREYHAIY